MCIQKKCPNLADQLATNYCKADIAPKQKAMLDFAVKVTLHSAEINVTDFEKMRKHGFSDD